MYYNTYIHRMVSYLILYQSKSCYWWKNRSKTNDSLSNELFIRDNIITIQDLKNCDQFIIKLNAYLKNEKVALLNQFIEQAEKSIYSKK